MTFKEFNLHESLLMGLQDTGFEEPTPIQEKSLPIILDGKDVLGAAQTGTGKTGAFVIPLIHKIISDNKEGTQALILSPTRELAQQIDEQIFALGYHTRLSSASVIGGENFTKQANAIRAGVDIIVATPGRLIDQMKVLNIDFSNLNYLVLDEADRMLDMGFLPDVTHIIGKLPKERQTLLFSATMPKAIQKLAQDIQKNPEFIEIEIETPVESVEQRAYLIDGREKLKVVQNLLDDIDWTSCIIFTATKKGTDTLERLLTKKGLKAASIHGDRDQSERTNALNDFKSGKAPIIVATDVLARGIDIDNVSVIINYDVPRQVEDYIHRIGRTGRYDKTGIAITLVARQDNKYFQAIESKIGKDLSVYKGFKPSGSAKKSAPVGNDDKPEKKQVSVKKDKAVENIEADFSKANSIVINTDKTENGKLVIELKNKPQEEKKEEKQNTEKKSSEIEVKKKPTQKKKETKTTSKPQKEKSKSSNKIPKEKAAPKRELKIKLKTVDKAIERNVNTRKPAKGVWGIIKSILPKF